MKPLKVKIFTDASININPPNEVQMNQWLQKNPGIEIVQMLQSEAMVVKENDIERNLTVTVLYREL
jgi:hypothetical protein